jgi:sugar lactone lactonase YvrE
VPDVAPELVHDVRAELGEGPLWDDRRRVLLFVDIMRGHVHAFDPVTKADRIYEVGEPVGAVACTERGDWVLAAGQGFARLDPDSGRVTAIVQAAPGRTDVRMNDGYVDRRGRFWAGTLSLARAAGQGTLYRLDPDGTVHTMLAPVTTSNGIDWSPDGKLMYYIDTRTNRVDVFDFDEVSGAIGNRRPLVEVPAGDGHPDGLVVDGRGGIWVAFWRGCAIRRYTPAGELDLTVVMPVSLVTKCAFGGPDLDELYITTARTDLTPAERAEQPQAGGVFRLKPGVRGQLANRFAG